MSIRLYLIAAYLDQRAEPGQNQGNLARSCLLGVKPLARTIQEEKLFASLARLLGDKQPLKISSSRYRNAEDRALVVRCQNALKGLRTQTGEKPTPTKREELKVFLKPYADVLPSDELVAAFEATCSECRPRTRSCEVCGGTKRAVQPMETIYKIVKIELALMERELLAKEEANLSQEKPASAKRTPWSQLVLRKESDPIRPLSIRYATEFDTAKSLFRNDSWVESDKPKER